MAIAPIPPIGSALPTNPVNAAGAGTSTAAGDAASSFGDALTKALDGVQAAQNNADQLSTLAATGKLNNVHDLTIATSEAELATQLTTAVRDKAVAAFNAIMSMPV